LLFVHYRRAQINEKVRILVLHSRARKYNVSTGRGRGANKSKCENPRTSRQGLDILLFVQYQGAQINLNVRILVNPFAKGITFGVMFL
jgi:hypothetical protein